MVTVNDLPPEIIVRIIRETFGPRPDWRDREIFRRLRMVSPRWRQICYNAMELWTSLNIDTRYNSPCGPQVTRWFARAGPLLPLKLTISETVTNYYPEDMAMLFALIRYHPHRWGELSLTLQTPSFPSIFGSDALYDYLAGRAHQSPQADAPIFTNLTRLDIATLPEHGHPRHLDFLAPNFMPVLHHVTLRFGPLPLPRCPQVKSLTIAISGPIGLVISPVLGSFLGLVSLEISLGNAASHVVNANKEMTVLQELRTLKLHGSRTNPGVWLALDSLICPSLAHIEMKFTFPPRVQIPGMALAKSIRNLAERSHLQHGLPSLAIKMDNTTAGDSSNWYELTYLLNELGHWLEEVELPLWPYTAATMPPRFLPKLRSLTVEELGPSTGPNPLERQRHLFKFLDERDGTSEDRAEVIEEFTIPKLNLIYVSRREIDKLAKSGLTVYFRS